MYEARGPSWLAADPLGLAATGCPPNPQQAPLFITELTKSVRLSPQIDLQTCSFGVITDVTRTTPGATFNPSPRAGPFPTLADVVWSPSPRATQLRPSRAALRHYVVAFAFLPRFRRALPAEPRGAATGRCRLDS